MTLVLKQSPFTSVTTLRSLLPQPSSNTKSEKDTPRSKDHKVLNMYHTTLRARRPSKRAEIEVYG